MKKTPLSIYIALCVLLFLEAGQSQLSFNAQYSNRYRIGRNQIAEVVRNVLLTNAVFRIQFVPTLTSYATHMYEFIVRSILPVLELKLIRKNLFG